VRAEHFATLGELAADWRTKSAIRWRELPASLRSSAAICRQQRSSLSHQGRKEETLQINRILTELLEIAGPSRRNFGSATSAARRARGDVRASAGHHQAHYGRVRNQGHNSTRRNDPNQINQVLLNLLLNAIQSMDKPGVIRVSLKHDDGAVFITVADEGKGIPPKRCLTSFALLHHQGHGTGLDSRWRDAL